MQGIELEDENQEGIPPLAKAMICITFVTIPQFRLQNTISDDTLRHSLACIFRKALSFLTKYGGYMKRMVLLCICLITLSGFAFSQDGMFSFGIQGNMINSKLNATLLRIVKPQGQTEQTTQILLDEVYGLGLGGGAHIDLNLPILTIRLSGDYISLAPDKDRFTQFVAQKFSGVNIQYSDGGRISVITGNVNGKLVILPIPVVKPYVTAGIGIANVTTTPVKLTFGGVALPEITLLKDQTVMTYNAGAGVDIGLGGVTLYGEIKVNWLSIEEGTGTFVPIATVGLTF
jgi:opacity protein-like surface antigen